MGYKLVKFNIVPEENEQIDAIVKLTKEPRSVIHGVVLDEHNKPLKDAVVKLLKVKDHHHSNVLEPITHMFTDECGQFLFGPLCPHIKYVVKVWFDKVKTRPIIIESHDCEDPCEHSEHECECECEQECDYECNYEFDE